MQITPGEEGFFAVGSGFENDDPSGVPSNVQAAGRCASLGALSCHCLKGVQLRHCQTAPHEEEDFAWGNSAVPAFQCASSAAIDPVIECFTDPH